MWIVKQVLSIIINFCMALSRILYLIAPSFSWSLHPKQSDISHSQITKLARSYHQDAVTDIPSISLSSTLEKLYAWEKKLYKEVKDEERLRLVYDNMCKRLKDLDARGAESSKIDDAQASVRRLLTKLDVCIKAIDAIASKIQKVRDEELQPQVTELIYGCLVVHRYRFYGQGYDLSFKLGRALHKAIVICIKGVMGLSLHCGAMPLIYVRIVNLLANAEILHVYDTTVVVYRFIRMWKLIVRCHQKQFQAIMASKTWNLKANTSSRSDATVELKTGLLTWCKHFEDWINAQKCYVNSLNGWLEQCIDHEPEVTIDGNVPFSPGRIGAPPIFIICNDWHKGIKCVSEEAVLTAFGIFGSSLRQLLERQDDEANQRLRTEQLAKDFSEKRQYLGMEHDMMAETIVGDDPKVELHLLRKKTDEARARHKETVKLVHAAASSSLQGGMIPLFKALQNFTCDALQAHEQVRLQKLSL
ncbi:hypothetical protein L6452_34800 [Arctium lappa]|uniref:Uncharacterized protein n=1 Tax=Arctium lappa TaxID=4217 RepID=A0ACB8YIJ6_ARCLA|nr:hypothetical protein L6452_34800 [Arctium lappa]